MDFISGLPKSKGKETILVVVDRRTKFAHFMTLAHLFIAIIVAHKFLKHVHTRHGLPESIVTDRDKLFLSNFWQALFSCITVLHTILRVMAKHRKLISALRNTSDA